MLQTEDLASEVPCSSGVLKTRSNWFPLLVITVVLSWLLVITCANWIRVVGTPVSLGYEGNIFWDTLMLYRGENIYSPDSLSQRPWAVNIYPPGFMTLGAGLFLIFGPQLWTLRALNGIGLILAFASSIGILKHFKCSWTILLAMVCSLLASSLVSGIPTIRVDHLGLGLSLFASYLFVLGWHAQIAAEKKGAFVFAASVLFSVLACLVKQQSLVVPLTIVVFCILQRRFLVAFKFGAAFLSITAVAACCVQLITGGFLQHLTFLAGAGWDLNQLFANLHGLRREIPKILATTFCFVWCRKSGVRWTGNELFPFLLLAISSLLMLYSMGIPASAPNHALTALFASAMCAGLCLKYSPSIFTLGFLLISCLWPPTVTKFPNVEPLMARTAATLSALPLRGKPILSEDPVLNFMSQSDAQIVDPTTFFNLWSRNGGFRSLENDVRNGSFAAIVLNDEDARCVGTGRSCKWPAAVLDAIASKYAAGGTITGNGYLQVIFYPRPLASMGGSRVVPREPAPIRDTTMVPGRASQ